MAQESQLAHRAFRNTALPYITNVSPINTDPRFSFGSADILTSLNGYAERRPGFADAVEPTPTTFNNLQRLFSWDRTDGSFYIMACDINAMGFAEVFKLQSGIDASFTSVYTDTGSTPFDFVVSNNTLYFSNGISAKKWDPLNGTSNWGIAIGSVNSFVGPTIAGAGTNGSGSHPWTNPNNVTSAINFATVALSTAVPSNSLLATTFGFAIPSSNTITGIEVSFVGKQSNAAAVLPGVQFIVTMLKAGVPIGTNKSQGNIPTTNTSFSFGTPSDLWGTIWVANDINQTNFGVDIVAYNPSGLASTFSVDNVQLTIFTLGGPSISVSGSAGTMTATAGYQYVFCYGNSVTGHISSPTPVSANTGVFTNKLNVSITLTASTDPQVNQIRVFRTTDGGGGTYFELPNSPFLNSSGAVTDNAADTLLQITSIAPTDTFNDPPTPFQGMVYFSGRIWGFTGNKVWFSGLEEINQGVPEESFPSGIAGNFWAFDEPVEGLAVAGTGDAQTLAIFCGGRIYGITGNTLDTFRRFLISNRRGCRNLETISMLGGMVGWLDSSNQIWASDGNSLQELSTDIRPDLVGINPNDCSMTFHVSGREHWCVFSVNSNNNTLPPTAAANVSFGIGAWANPNNIFAADGNFATATTGTFGTTDKLQGTAFGFAGNIQTLPIIGIQVQIKGFQTDNDFHNTFQVQLLKNGVAFGDIKSTQLPLANGFVNVGGLNDTWGAAWNYYEIASSTFGVQMWGFDSTGAGIDWNVDYVQIVVYYGGTFVYDMDTGQWMPPWTFAAEYIYSGEISPGNYKLMVSNGTKALQLNPDKFNDNTVTYQPVMKFGLSSIVPDFGTRFAYTAMASYDEPTRTGWPDTFQVTNNAQTVTNFQILADENPNQGVYTDITASLQTPATAYNRAQGTYLTQNVYKTITPTARWISMQVRLAKADQVDNVYEVFMAYKGAGGR